MPLPERLPTSLAENLMSCICHRDDVGKLVVNLVTANHFSGEYRIVVERAINYWAKYKTAPKEHTVDLVSDILDDKHNRRAGTYRRILTDMVQLAPTINPTYVLDQARRYLRMQAMQGAILQSAERLNAQQDLAIEEVEELWNEILRARQIAFEPGTRLTEYQRVLSFMEKYEAEFKLGIAPLDTRHIAPMRGGIFLFLGASGRGKTWFAIHVGRAAVGQRKKVVHISLEMSEEQLLQRYYQSMFAIPKRHVEEVELTTLTLDENEGLAGFEFDSMEPEFSFTDHEVQQELETRIGWTGTKYENLIIKRFPTRSLTMNGLRAYLDNLELVEGFVPDLLILDAPYLMAHPIKDYRLSLGRVYEELRGLLIERNIAGLATHQLSRQGAQAEAPGAHHIAEDWSLIQTSDFALVLQSTEAEFNNGLARIFVAKARDERDKFGILLTQNYTIGQFALQAIYLEDRYWDYLQELRDQGDEEVVDDDADDE